MKVSTKYIIGTWVVLLSALILLIYTAYSKLKPEVLISILSEQVQRNFPGTILEVGNTDYRVSVDFKMGLKDILFKRSDTVIGSLDEIELRIPIWLLLFQRGKAQINLSNLVVFIDENKIITDSEDLKRKIEQVGRSSQINLKGPAYLTDTQFTLRAKNISVVDVKNSKNFTLNKLLVREFQFGKNSAFELNLPVKINHGVTSYRSELWLFGDLTPEKDLWKLNFRGEFRTSDSSEKLQLEDLIIDGSARFKPHELDLNSKLTFFIEKKKMGSGNFAANDKEFNLGLNFTNFPLRLLALFEEEIRNPYLPMLAGDAEGLIQINKKYNSSAFSLDGSFTYPGAFDVKSVMDNDVSGQWKLRFTDAKWETSFISPKGDVSFFRRSVIDFEKGGVVQYVEELGFSEIEFKGPIQLVLPLEKILTAGSNDYFSSSFSFKKCKIGDQLLEGGFHYGISPDQRFYTGELKSNKSSFQVNFEQSNNTNKLDLKFSRFSWMKEYVFLTPFFSAAAGELDGKLEGRWDDQWSNGQWLSKLTGTSLQGMSGEWIKVIDNFWKFFEIKSSLISDQSWNLSAKKALIFLDSIILKGPDPATLNGQIDLDFNKKSFLVLNYPKNLKWKPVKKEITESFWNKE
jgi:hypothetical protein